jgi:hypothetical protein
MRIVLLSTYLSLLFLFVGCNTTPDESTSTATPLLAQEQSTSTSIQEEEYQYAMDMQKKMDSLRALENSTKKAIVKTSLQNKQIKSTSTVNNLRISDIAVGYLSADLNKVDQKAISAGYARNYFMELLQSSEINATAEEIEEINALSDEDFDKILTSLIFEEIAESYGIEKNTKSVKFFGKMMKVMGRGVKMMATGAKLMMDPIGTSKMMIDGGVQMMKTGVGMMTNPIGTMSKMGESMLKMPSIALDVAGEMMSGDIVGAMDEAMKGVATMPIMQPMTAAMFKTMLGNGQMTIAMLDMSMDSPAMVELMIEAMLSDWSISTKMIPLLEGNKEFGEKFTILAMRHENLVHFFFRNIDGPLYRALTKGMLLSPYVTTKNLSILMKKHALSYLVLPSSLNTSPGGDRFASLLFNTGGFERGDVNEIANERFFYAMFQTPESTSNFVEAMQEVQKYSQETVTGFLDFVILGKGLGEEDVDQSYYNIYAMVKGMVAGIKRDGLSTYMDGFIGFAGLVPFERYWSYAKRFTGAGLHYYTSHDLELSDFTTLVSDAIFNYDKNETAKSEGETIIYYNREKLNVTYGLPYFVQSDEEGNESVHIITRFHDFSDEYRGGLFMKNNYTCKTNQEGEICTEDYDKSPDRELRYTKENEALVMAINGKAYYVVNIDFEGYSQPVELKEVLNLRETDIEPHEWDRQNITSIGTISLDENITLRVQVYDDEGKKVQSESDEDEAWYEGIWDAFSEGLNTVYANFDEWWNETSVALDAYLGEMIDGVSGEAHQYVEGHVQELTDDENYVLPPFNDLSLDYVYDESVRRVDNYLDTHDSSEILRDFSENQYVNELLYEDLLGAAQSSEYWEYIPTWLSNKDWLKLPANYETYSLDFTSDHVVLYIVSKNDSLANMREVTGWDELIQVDTLADSPMTNLSDEMYIYKKVIFSGEDIDFSALAVNVEDASDYISGIAIDTSRAVDSQ